MHIQVDDMLFLRKALLMQLATGGAFSRLLGSMLSSPPDGLKQLEDANAMRIHDSEDANT